MAIFSLRQNRHFFTNPKRVFFLILAIAIVLSFFLTESKTIFAATGINENINFQGKVINSNGTNVTDGDYDFIFRLYKVSTGGTAQWTGTWNSGSTQVTVTDGVFQVALGTQTSLSSLDFNDDSWYLSVEFNGDGEMTPRIRFTSVPFAFNAKKVAGLTVTNTTGTLTLVDAKTFTISSTLTLDGTDGTTFTFPSATDTVVGLAATQTLTNKTIGSTGLTFSGATTDITTGTNEALTLSPNGSGDIIISGDADTNLQVTFSAAPGIDMVAITNTGQGTTTNGVDGLSIDFTAATGGSGETNAGAHITITDSGDSGDTIAGLQITAGTAGGGTQYGIGIDAITGGAGAEYGINIAAGWDRGLSIADATGNSILLASDDGDVASGITFGSTNAVNVYRSAAGELTITDGASNSFVFDTVNGPAYSGTARPIRKITLSPEYAGATLTVYYGAGTDTVITGSMTSDTDTTQGTSIRNYYEWNSSETAAQNFYTTAVRITLPADFSAWATSNALVVNYITESATTTQSDLDVRVYNENSATIVASDLDNSSTSWTTVVIDDSVLDDGAGSEWDAAGETVVVYLRMGSQDDDNVHIGDIELNYLAAF